ncbi:MAG TPA: acyl-CoA synthetase [Rhizomicrobium sp.]|nr:acyl-CoA synthetase [Rhizomicrobium sp.]
MAKTKLSKKKTVKAKKAVEKAAPKKKPAAKKKPAPKPKPPSKSKAPPAARKAPSRGRPSLRRRVARAVTRAIRAVTPQLGGNPYERDLDRNPANHQPLTPLTFLERAARTFPERIAIVHGERRFTYADFYERSKKLASALAARGIKKGDTVSAMMANTPGMLEMHYGVPMTGAVINTLNTRLDAAAIAFMLDHAETKILITDREFAATIKPALALAKVKPLVVDYDDREFPQTGEMLGEIEYEAFVAAGDPDYAWVMPKDEWDAISLNYTSGTTGNPKGVVFHHRGAALMGYGNVIAASLPRHPVYLWTLPMFHCNGWCFPWSLSVVAGTHVCLRWVRPNAMYDALADHGVTHLCGAPIVMSTLINARDEERRELPRVVQFITAAAPPPEQVLAQMAEAGFNVTHVYGLTETYGPAVVNEWKADWDDLDALGRASKKARQGVRYHALDALTVMDPETMEPTPADGTTLGEVMFRGNIVMKGYLKNPTATREAFEGGWFHSGDLGVMHEDGYVQLKDRSKDIIISGGENISSIEVEDTLLKHPSVMFAAVVARPDDKWGETPCAFVEKKPGHESTTGAELIAHCRENLAHYKCPRHVVFVELPKTSTGKVQKFKLREMAKQVV